MRIEWERSNGMPVEPKHKDECVEKAIEESVANESGIGIVMTGDALILATHEDGSDVVEVYDCRIRRTAEVEAPLTPAEKNLDCSDCGHQAGSRCRCEPGNG